MSQPQHLTALEQANRVRIAFAQLKREIHSGEVSVEQALTDHRDRITSTATVRDLLRAQRDWGNVRCRRILQRSKLADSKSALGLTPRQIAELSEMIQGSARHGGTR